MEYFVLFLALSTLFVIVPAWIIRNGDWETIFQAVMITIMALIPVSVYQSVFGV